MDPARILGLGKIPWDDPDLSRRMLREHLSQRYDSASRRKNLISKQVDWIHRSVLSSQPAKILDLGCGPGLYACQLAALGHDCDGIDFSPASIEFAKEETARLDLTCRFKQADFIFAEYGSEFDLVMMVFSELNTFELDDIDTILKKSIDSLARGVKGCNRMPSKYRISSAVPQPSVWYSEKLGVFSDDPYLCLTESFWDEESVSAVERYFVITGSDDGVQQYINRTRAFEEKDYIQMLEDAGFTGIIFHPSLTGSSSQQLDGMFVIIAEKP